MRCIFCRQDSSTSRSVEHIIPESLGNSTYVLPVGVVCDGCNQYFARKVERQLLESPALRLLRASMAVPNKRGRFPSWQSADGTLLPTRRQMARFLAKVGLEVLAFRSLATPQWNDEIVDHSRLFEVREFSRYNKGPDWPFTVRTLHPANAVLEEDGQAYELLHEFDILITESSEAYFVISIFGVEMVINLGGRDIDGYRVWLEANNYASPLYVTRNA